MAVMLLQPGNGLLPLFLQVKAGGGQFLPAFVGGIADLALGDRKLSSKFRDELVCKDLLAGKCHKWI